MNSICSHLGHLSQRFSGASLRATSARSFGRTTLVSQCMGAVSHEWASGPSSPPKDAERRREIRGLLDLAKRLLLLVGGTELLRGVGREVGDDRGLPGHLVDRDGQN